MSPSRQMLKRKQKNVPNSHANAVFPASQRLSSPWCAPVVTRVKRAFGALGKQVFTHFRTQAAPQCTCANEKKSASAGGESPHCIHGAALLWIIHNLPREDPVAKPYVPCTSSACRWNIPGQGEVYDVLKPVAHMPITRDDPSKPFKRYHPSRSKEAERAKYVAYTPNDARNNVRDAPTRVAAMATLCEVIKGDLEGAPCAYDRQWQMTAAVTDDDDF